MTMVVMMMTVITMMIELICHFCQVESDARRPWLGGLTVWT